MFGEILKKDNIDKLIRKNYEKILTNLNTESENAKLLFDQIISHDKKKCSHKISIRLSSLISLNSIRKRYTEIMNYFKKALKM